MPFPNPNETLRQVAKDHAKEETHHTAFVPNWGWLCEQCDDDFYSFDWPADRIEHYPNVFLPPIGAYVRVVWWDNVTAVGTVEDHALDNSGFDLGFTYAELADLKNVTVLDVDGTIPRTIDMGIIKIT